MRSAALAEAVERTSQTPRPVPGAVAAGAPGALLALQRTAGNRAVAHMVRRGLARRPARLQRLPTGEGGDTPEQLTSPRFAGEPLLEACFQDRARMTVGARDTGERQPVSKVQQALVELGFELGTSGANGDGVDGVYGGKTAAAVRAFKAREQLGSEQFGDVGPGTMHRLNDLFPAQRPACADEAVDVTPDPLPAVPPFTFSVVSQRELAAAIPKSQTPPGNPLAISQPSFERVPFKEAPDQTFPVTVSAIPTGDPSCFKCAAEWTLPVAWRSLIGSGPFVLDEAKRFFVSRAGDASGCPPRSLPRLLDVRELVTPEVRPFLIAGEREHYLDFVRAFRMVGGRYLGNVGRLSPERTHLRTDDPAKCEAKVQSFLVLAHGRPFREPAAGGEPQPAAGGEVELNFLKLYTSTFRDDFLAFYLSPDRDRAPDGPHFVRPEPPQDRPPTLPNIDVDINPFGCDAFCRKLTARSFRGLPGGSSEALVKDDNLPIRQAWHSL